MNDMNALYHMELEAFNWTLSASSSNIEWQVGDSSTTEAVDHPLDRIPPLNVPYTIFEILVALVAVVGNAMVIYVFRIERKLRRRTNYYIVSLAIADLFVGLFGIPFAILAAIGLPTNLHACLFTISLLVVLCTISIFCLVAVSIDRYWAILHPMAYSRNVRTRTAIVIIAACWLAGILIGLLPLFGWHAPQNGPTVCLFVKVMSYDYLVFLYFGTIVTPAILLIAFYAHIYRVIVRQLRQIVTMNPTGTATSSNSSHIPNPVAPSAAPGLPSNNSMSTNIVTGFVQQLSRRSSTSRKSITPTNTSGNQSNGANTPEVSPRTQSPFTFSGNTPTVQGGTMLRVLGAAQKREVKATQNLSIIVLFFMICWLPLYTVNCVKAFCQDCEINSALMLALIALSHVNSAVNPLLYAYHLRDFRAALKNLILRMMGREVPRTTTTDIHRRISAASRMQSMREQKRSFHPRIYIDSPVWMRQQQAQQQMGSTGHYHSKVVGGGVVVNGGVSMGSALRSVVRVASTPTDATNTPDVMSQIAEVPSHAERESSKNLNESSFGQLSNYRAGQFSKKSSQSSNMARSSNHQSFDCYMSDGRGRDGNESEDEDEDEGIKIVIHKEGKMKNNSVNINDKMKKNYSNEDEDEHNYSVANYSSENISNSRDKRRRRRGRRGSITGSSSDEDEDDVFVTSTSSPEPNKSESISSMVANYEKQKVKQETVLHSTDLPTFHHHLNLDERSFYDAFKRRRRQPRPRPLGRSDSSCSLERRIRITKPPKEEDPADSTGTISSEDLTEFRDKSASSLFIIENDTVELSPRHEKTDDGSINSSVRRGNLEKQQRRRSSSKDILMKHSPLKVVTQLIFASNCEVAGGMMSGRFNYVDMEDEQQAKGCTPKKSGGKFLRSVSDS